MTFGASRLLIIENAEPALHAVTESLTVKFPAAQIEGRIADIRDRERIMHLMTTFQPDIVFHAAALKHVPILERDWGEGVKTNIFGTVNVADAAAAAGAQAMVMISTDKAIEPVSMLGLTKRFAEMYCQALDRHLANAANGKTPMRLISVRFGNVLASNGSVVPKFKAQIEAGGPVTVTHPDMVRYFMTIREACDLVVTAATHALGPVRPDVSVYVLNMGQPVKIVDLAERIIRLSGLQPGYDIEIVFTGVRPGERMNEILFASEEPTAETGIEGIMAARPIEPPLDTLQTWLITLQKSRQWRAAQRDRRHPQGRGARVQGRSGISRRLCPAMRKAAEHKGNAARAGCKRESFHVWRGHEQREGRQPRKCDVEDKYLGDHLQNAEAIIRRTLIEMRTMGDPNRFTFRQASQQGDRCIS